jgi:hypothetical protein
VASPLFFIPRKPKMRSHPFKQDSTTAHPAPVSNDFVREALAKQAALRPAPTPPRLMPVTPTLPKVPKPHRHRRRPPKA